MKKRLIALVSLFLIAGCGGAQQPQVEETGNIDVMIPEAYVAEVIQEPEQEYADSDTLQSVLASAENAELDNPLKSAMTAVPDLEAYGINIQPGIANVEEKDGVYEISINGNPAETYQGGTIWMQESFILDGDDFKLVENPQAHISFFLNKQDGGYIVLDNTAGGFDKFDPVTVVTISDAARIGGTSPEALVNELKKVFTGDSIRYPILEGARKLQAYMVDWQNLMADAVAEEKFYDGPLPEEYVEQIRSTIGGN